MNSKQIKLGIASTVDQCSSVIRSLNEADGRLPSRLSIINLGITSNDEVPSTLTEICSNAGVDIIVHFEELNLVSSISWQRAEALIINASRLKPLWAEEDIGYWLHNSTCLQGHLLPPILDSTTLDTVINNIASLQNLSKIKFFPENPPFSIVIETIDLLQFMARVAQDSQTGLVFDIGHYIGYCHLTERDPFEYIQRNQDFIGFIREVHIAGYTFTQTMSGIRWFDDHSQPLVEAAKRLLCLIVQASPNIEVVTLEQESLDDLQVVSNLWDLDDILLSCIT